MDPSRPGTPGRQAQALLPGGGLEIPASPCGSDEILEPELHDLDTESPDPAAIRALGIT